MHSSWRRNRSAARSAICGHASANSSQRTVASLRRQEDSRSSTLRVMRVTSGSPPAIPYVQSVQPALKTVPPPGTVKHADDRVVVLDRCTFASANSPHRAAATCSSSPGSLAYREGCSSCDHNRAGAVASTSRVSGAPSVVRRHRQAVPDRQLAAVDLVADDRRRRARARPRSEGPCPRRPSDPAASTVYAPLARGTPSAVSRVAATREREPGHRRLGPPDPPIGPRAGEEALVGRAEHGSSAARYLKHAIARRSSSNRTCHQHVFPLKNAALPPRGEEGLDRVAHPPRPVLVVADGQEEPMAVEDLGVPSRSWEIATSMAKPSRSAHATNGRSQVHQPAPPLHGDRPCSSAHAKYPRASRSGIGLRFPRRPAPASRGIRGERALERDAGATGVERGAAPVVVGVVRGRGQHEEDRRRGRRGRTTKNASARSSPDESRSRSRSRTASRRQPGS